MKRVYVNEKWCLGCHLCEYYCAFANSGKSSMVKALKDHKIAPRIRIEERDNISFAVSCRHCTDPLCVKGFGRAVHRGWGRADRLGQVRWLLHLHPVLPLWRAVHFE